MAFNLKRTIYDSLPLPIKRGVGLVPFSVLAGKSYRKTLSRRLWIDRIKKEDLRRYQEAELKKILDFAVDQVPAYKPFRSIVGRLQPFEALKAFPLLDKDKVQARQPDFLPRDFLEIPHYETSTGGNKWEPTKFFCR